MAPPAKHNKSEVDRLSSLPESLLLQILSLMETRFAVQTSILSTRYRHLWTFLPNLSFDSKNFPKLPSFDKFVTHVITHHDHQSKVSSISYDRRGKSSKPIIKVFKHIVSQQSIEHLKVSGCIGKIGEFVSGVFNCQSLQTLQLENCMSYFYFSEILRVPANFCLPSLTTLYLESVRFPRSDKVNNECSVSFSECPNLKNLTLISLNICHLKLFHLVCSRVENLTYTLDNFKLCGAKVVLTAPKLTHFNLEGPLPIRLYFDNVSSLEVADIGGTISSTKFVRPLIHMLNKFSNLKCVTISSFDVVEVRI